MKLLRLGGIASIAILLVVAFSFDTLAGRRSRETQSSRDRDRQSVREPREPRQTRTRQRTLRYSELKSGDVVELAMSDGKVGRFELSDAPLLSGPLGAAYPDIKSFRVRDADDAASRGRFVVFDERLHGIVLSGGDAVTISASTGRTSSARRAARPAAPECGNPDLGRVLPGGLELENFSAGSDVRSYRLVIAAAAEFTAAAGGATGALEAIVAFVNDMTAIYERDAAVTFVLEDTLIFEDPLTDPFPAVGDDPSSAEFSDLINAGQMTVNDTVMPANYDLGLTLTTSAPAAVFGATAGSACDDAGKAAAAISSDAVLGGDTTTALAHQIGHLFGATHTYNSTLGECTARDAGTAYEPGSGSTIMGGGNCDAETVPDAGAYFHNASIEQILAFRDANLLCGIAAATGNTPPTVDAGADATVPRSTPFLLMATGDDVDGDSLAYTWEQFDLGAASPPLNDADGPLFRSLAPGADAWRTFPSPETLLSGVPDDFDRLPTVDRSLTFRATVRDGNGGVSDDEAVITVAGDPFVVLAPNGGETFAGGCPMPVSWEVGGGSIATTVNILALDGNTGDSEILAAATPNDGAEDVTACLAAEPEAVRVVVEAEDGIFFDLSDTGLTIELVAPEVTAELSATPVDEQCMSTVSYTAAITDDCSVDAADVAVGASVTTANAMLGDVSLDAMQVGPAEVSAAGSVVVSDLTGSPATVAVEFTAADSCGVEGVVVQEISVSDLIPPVVTCPADVVIECSAFGGVPADDPQLEEFFSTFLAEDNCDPDPVIGNDAPDFFPLGSTGVEWSATDASGNTSACTAIVTVVDTTPPDLAVSVSPTSIWPPNHKLWDVTARVDELSDICDPEPELVLFSVESNEPANGQGDGNTEPDIEGADLGTADLSFQVRAERSGQGGGRVYTILYTATDDSGNQAEDTSEVSVPHDQRNKNRSR